MSRGVLCVRLPCRCGEPTLVLAASSLRTEGHGLSGPCCHADDDTPSLATSDQHDLRRAIATARASSGHAASLEPLVARIRAWQTAGLGVVCGARTTTQAERLALMLNNRQVTAKITAAHGDPVAAWASDPSVVRIVIGRLTRGVIAPTAGLALVTEEEIFGSRVHRRRTVRRRGRDRALEDLRALTTGDYVVHVDHGIGRYHGLVHRQVGGHQVELIEVHYAGGDKLYLPVHRLNQIHKLRGANSSPKLDRLGGQSFAHTKSRTRKKVRRIADELVRLYAERQAARGVATPPVDDEYHAFAASFPFEETDDQLRAIDEVAVDLQSERPMDRLVCGDVGFGKTEVALRAAFRVAMAGRQVAVLCPTTVLAQQHQLTFEARLRDYPLRIEALSRFTSKKQQTRILRELSSGQIDILVGTHRVLSKDVHFKELGLLVVDEEQRFGVTHKERLKSLKTNVDVLTLTATPIPRTLQMAVSGLRDMSIITTPPADRRAVRTIVSRSDPEMVREALERELGRGGQVFYVYNRIEGLTERAALVQALVPNARVRVAHGQMGERALERTMLEFVAGQSDILCSTAIIENGLDIARCNTIIIDRADLFGMTQLYQLRGRVGRSKERAYCYLMLPPHDQLSSDAAARVEALQRHSALGSGFEIAALDLDLRGAGDVLGAEQSGTIATIGFEMFCRMLDEAVHELRGEPHADEVEPELSLDVEALFPERYIPDIGLRLSLYKRLSSARSNEEIDAVAEEIEDRFGRAPESARRLLQLMQLKVALRSLRVLACEASARAVTFTLRDDAPIDAGKLATLVSARKDCFKLSPDARLTRRANQGELFQSGLDAAQTLVTELHGVMT